MREKCILIILCLTAISCSHSLEIKNLDDFVISPPVEETEREISLGITPFTGRADGKWYFNVIMEKLASRHKIKKIKNNYLAIDDFKPDYIISINLKDVEYEGSFLNWIPLSWPCGLFFAPVINGYIYYCNIKTSIAIYDKQGTEMKKLEIDTPYSIRQAELDRTLYTVGLVPLLTFTLSSLEAGVVTTLYDADITKEFQSKVRDNYGNYIVENIMKEIVIKEKG